MSPVATFGLAFGVMFVLGSLVEYFGHRLMHAGVLLHRAHMRHHARNQAKGVTLEALHYLLGTAILLPWGFLVSRPAGFGVVAGGVAYAFFSAYGHQLQHDNPARCFWMRMPVHYVHHNSGMSDANFGLALPIWDHVFGTYRAVPVDAEELRARSRPGGPLDVRWI